MTRSTFDCPDGTSRDKAARPGFWRFAANILAKAKHGLVVRSARRQLHALPDYLLKDMGISRCGTDYLAAHGEHAARLVSGRTPADRPYLPNSRTGDSVASK